MRTILIVAALSTLAVEASAQPHAGAVVDVLAGLEGGGRGYAAGVRRTRTTLRLGFEGWIEEAPDSMLALAALVELEPVAAFGADLRYQHRFAEAFVVHLGATSVLIPETMLGASAGFGYRVGIGKAFALAFGPTVNVYFVGDDLADEVVLWQAMLGAGARVWF